MKSLVSNQRRALAEGRAALAALIGLLPSVDPSVLPQDRAMMKGPSTHLTFVRLLSAVDSSMIGQVGFPTESSTAL